MSNSYAWGMNIIYVTYYVSYNMCLHTILDTKDDEKVRKFNRISEYWIFAAVFMFAVILAITLGINFS